MSENTSFPTDELELVFTPYDGWERDLVAMQIGWNGDNQQKPYREAQKRIRGSVRFVSISERKKQEREETIAELREDLAVMTELYELARCGSIPTDTETWEETFRAAWRLGRSNV